MCFVAKMLPSIDKAMKKKGEKRGKNIELCNVYWWQKGNKKAFSLWKSFSAFSQLVSSVYVMQSQTYTHNRSNKSMKKKNYAFRTDVCICFWINSFFPILAFFFAFSALFCMSRWIYLHFFSPSLLHRSPHSGFWHIEL